MLLYVVAGIGVTITAYACVRAIVAIRRGEGRDAVVGWFALMVAPAIVVFALDRLISIL